MTTNISVSPSDLEKIVRDVVSKVDADKAAENMARAQEVGERAMKDGGGIDALARLVRNHEIPERAKVENGALVSDPHKGKGLGFARFARSLVMMQLTKAPLIDAARELSKTDKSYQSTVDLIESKSELRTMSVSSMSSGGALVPTEMASEMIELLYAKTVSLELGARTMEFSSSISLGRMNSGATAYYVGEAANITPSQPGFGELRMTGKKIAAIASITNELLRNPSVGADAIVRDALLHAMAERRDLSVLRGAGDSNQPKGVTKWINSSNYFNSTGTTTAQKIADIVKAVRLVDESQIPLDSGGWVMSPRSKWSLFATLDSNSNYVFAAQLALGMLLGFPLRSTRQIPNNLGGGSDSEVYFGAWNDLIIGYDKTTPMQLESFPNGTWFDGSALVSGVSNDTTPIRLLEAHDVVLRHDNTFSRIDAVAWT